ncbi:MAG: DUF4293 domain-containing protein [Prevotella sp.]|nr:DUF4293 domain-containing protein [Prevotella sp.]
MIQRKQTVFLFLAAVFGVLALCMQLATVSYEGLTTYRIFSLWAIGQSGARSFVPCPLFILMLLSTTLSVCTIFIYKRRPLQAKLCMVNILVILLWYISMIVVSKQLSPDAMNFQMEIASSFPAVMAILLFMARKGILADEKLVRAADRIR